MNFKEIKKELFKREFNKKTLSIMYGILLFLLLGIFIQNIFLAYGGIQVANALGNIAHTNINQTRIMSIIAERQMNPLFEIEKENFKNKGQGKGTHYLPRK